MYAGRKRYKRGNPAAANAFSASPLYRAYAIRLCPVGSAPPALKKANVKHDMKVYPGAPHSFFDRKFTEFADASADAWKRVQSFVGANTRT